MGVFADAYADALKGQQKLDIYCLLPVDRARAPTGYSSYVMATTTSHFNIQTQPIKPKRRRCRETTISSTASAVPSPIPTPPPPPRNLDPPTVVSSQTSCCCPPPPPPPPIPRLPSALQGPGLTFSQETQLLLPSIASAPAPHYPSPPLAPSTLKIRFSPGTNSPVMDFTPISGTAVNGGSPHDSFPSSFSKFNSALTAGLLNPMSPPPPPPPSDKTRSSPTLFEMMASEPECQPRSQIAPGLGTLPVLKPPILVHDKSALMMQRISELLASRSPGNQFNDMSSSDIKLTLSSKDGLSVSMNVHRQILVAHSRFFALKLSDRSKQQQQRSNTPYIVEIADCDDVEIYIETLRLMYCKDLRKKLMKEDVSRVLGILKVSAAIEFDAGVLSCLEYLEAAPWAEDEEEKVAALLSDLRLEGVVAGEVLKRVSVEINAECSSSSSSNENEQVLVKLLHVVLEGKDEKARREMKGLVLKMLRENASQSDLRKESLYSACHGCLELLRRQFLLARGGGTELQQQQDVGQIARQADNLHWILDILIDRQIGEEFLKIWASQSELSEAHSKVPVVHRYEVSRVTARLFVGIGKGQLLASKDARCLLLQTWLVPFYDDFGWMRRASRGLDRHLVEDGLSNTILTLPLPWQQEIFLAWFDRFLNSGEDCPNIQRGFEVWWRRAFWRRHGKTEQQRQFRITTATATTTTTIENS